MRLADLAKELKITESYIESKIKSLKLRMKEGGEITAGVEMILRDALADEGIGKRVVDEPEEKKPVKKVAKKTTTKKATAKSTAQADEDKPKKTAKKTTKKAVKKESVKEVIIEAKHQKAPVTPAINVKAEKKEAALVKPVAPPVINKEISKEPVVITPTPVVPSSIKTPEAPKVQPAPVEQPPKPIIDLSKIDIKEEVPFETVKKKEKFDAPFVAVKPLNKKRRRDDMGGQRGYGPKVSSSIESAVVPEVPVVDQVRDLELILPITVNNLAVKMQQKTNVVLKKLLSMGIFANINQTIPEDIVKEVALSFGFNVVKGKTQEEELLHVEEQEKNERLISRAPVVTFMGHVDHGKTSLVDRIRSSKIADDEHGGITQHIGAYSVALPKGTITFLDTPGHEAFTAMRSRGANITDIVVIVIAADEGIMPQTIEAIDHARAAGVPIMVALNKIDKKTANPDRVKKQLADIDLMPEDWGGKTVVVGVSAHTGEGIDNLLELILLESELLELKVNADKNAAGIVIEAHMSKGRGAVASLIIQSGTLREGDMIVVGPYMGRVKALFDDHERPIKEAGPSSPVEILGLSDVPSAGEKFYVIKDEKKAREIAEARAEKIKAEKLSGSAKISLEDLYTKIKDADVKEMRLVIKTDVQGSLEAMREALTKIPQQEVKLRIMHGAVGDVNTSDVLLALASEAVIIAFNVRIDHKAQQELEKSPVDVREYRIIYDAVEDIRKALEGMLAPKIKKIFLGRAEVRQVFKLSKGGIIAGCYIQKGKIKNRSQVVVLRNGQEVFVGNISSLKRFKDDVKEVGENYECGIGLDAFPEGSVSDMIEAFDVEHIARKL